MKKNIYGEAEVLHKYVKSILNSDSFIINNLTKKIEQVNFLQKLYLSSIELKIKTNQLHRSLFRIFRLQNLALMNKLL